MVLVALGKERKQEATFLLAQGAYWWQVTLTLNQLHVQAGYKIHITFVRKSSALLLLLHISHHLHFLLALLFPQS